MPKQFYGREKELRLLRELRQDSPQQAKLAVVFGRRRVGKSSLILEAFSDEELYVFEGLENRASSEQIQNFRRQLIEHFGETSTPIENWHDALLALAKQTNGRRLVILFDEFQWMANYRRELITVLKLIWDQHLVKNQGLTLVLCGSVASFMLKKVVKSKALYGRSHLAIHLKPFLLHETSALLPNRGSREIIEAQLLLGGIPEYLKLLSAKPSVMRGIQELGFEEHGYFVTEFERIFVSHFATTEVYGNIVRCLAKHPAGLERKRLADETGLSAGGSFSGHLEDLELAGIITAYRSFHLGPQSKSRMYVLSDPYIRLFLRFIEPNLPRINAGVVDLFIKLSGSQAFKAWLGYGCELLCIEHRYQLARLMGFSDVDFSVGPYFAPRSADLDGVQVDLIYDRKDSVVTICEIKYSEAPPGIEVIDAVERKVQLVPNQKNKTIQKALITKTFPTKPLLDQAYFAHIVQLDQLLAVPGRSR